MNIDQMITDLKSKSGRNETLRLLGQIVVDTDPCIIENLTAIIRTPETIEDTNRFASLLVSLSHPDFIPPLVDSISQSDPNATPWLADFMYALEGVLRDHDEWLHVEESLVHLLGKWVFTTGGGEISCKAALILAEIEHPSTREYFMKGAFDQSLLHLTRVACIRGIVNHYRSEAKELLQALSTDFNEHVRDAVADAEQFLSLRETAT